MTFYGLATTQSGASVVIKEFTATDRIGVENEAKAYCKKQGLIFGSVLPEKNTAKGGSTLTKYAKQRQQSNNKR
jgi:putative hemolysin